MKHVVKKQDIIWGYLSQFLNIASNLLLLPFILRCLSQEEIGLWYVFVAMAGLIQLLEFGLLPTISRFISYVYSGASQIIYNKVPECNKGHLDKEYLNNVVAVSRKIYSKISLIAFFSITVFGNIYLYSLNTSSSHYYIMACWTLYGISICVQLYFGYYNSILKGRGDQTTLNKVIVLTKTIFLTVSIPLLITGVGLLSLSIASALAVVIDRIIITRCVFSPNSYLDRKFTATSSVSDLKRIVWRSARDMGIVQLGNYLSVRAGVLIVSSFVGLGAAATYGLTIQVTMVVVIVSSMLFGLNLPHITSEQALRNYPVVKQLMKKSLLMANAIYLVSAVLFLLLGNFLLGIVTHNTHFLPTALLALYLFTALLEMNYSICTSYLTTKNNTIFLNSMIISGVSIMVLSCILTYYFHMGILGVILSQLIVQCAYNNWRWPVEVYRELRYVKC